MNYLAHTVLSKSNIEYQLGNLLADPLKGKRWEGATDEHYAGMRMHAAIDIFTDANATISLSKSRLRKKGYLKGVVIDMTYDYFLSKHWDTFVKQDLRSFVDEFHQNAEFVVDDLPEKASSFISNITKHDILASYIDFNGLEIAFSRIDRRLSPRLAAKETTASYIPNIIDHYDEIETDFLTFFPQLIAYFLDKSGSSTKEQYFK